MKTKLFFLLFLLTSTTNINAQAPIWTLAKSFGSNVDEMAPCITLDHDGNLYVLGHHTALSLTFDSTTIYNSSPNNAYLTKYDPQGEVIFAKNLNIDINPARITVDKDNNLIAVAFFMETLVIGNITVHKTSEGGNNASDQVILKFDSNGNIMWASQGYGSNSFDRFSGLAMDDSSNIYVGGAFDGTKIIFNNDTIINTGGNDVFLLKFNSIGEQIWARGVYGNLEEIGGGICIDKDGFIYNTGTYTSQTINFEGTNTLSNHGNNLQNKSIFFAKYTPSGSLVWSKRIGGDGNEETPFIGTDLQNNIYLAGTSQSDPIFYESTTIPNNEWNTFIVKFDPNASLLWSKSSTGIGYKTNKDFAIDTIGNTYVYGYFFNQYSFGPNSISHDDNPDIFLTKISSTGDPLWSRFITGNQMDISDNISLHPNGSVYVSGSFQSDTLYIGSQQLINNSIDTDTYDIFIAVATPLNVSSNSPLCIGNNLQLSISSIPNATYLWTGPNNFSSTERNPILENCTENMSGYYSVKIVVPGINDIIDSININIYPIPEIPTASNSGDICKGSSVTLLAESIENAIYHWTDVSGSSIVGQSPIITPDTSGYYFLQVEINGCISAPDSTYIIVKPLPESPTIYGNSVVCIGSQITLYADTIINVTYHWTGPNNFTSIDQNPFVCSKADLSNSGYYYASVFSNGCFSPSDSIIVVVNPPMNSPNICIVGNDSVYHKNMIVWNKEISTAIIQYNIYKESNILNEYEMMGSVHYDSLSVFVDQSSNSLERSFRYRISLVDTCGVESELSPDHKTVHLSMYQGLDNTYNLLWNNYEGVSVMSYKIYRGISNDSLVLLTTLSSAVNSYTDFSPHEGFVYYQIETTGDFNCISSESIYLNSSKSNIASNDPNYMGAVNLLSVFPVPADNHIRVSAPTNVNGQFAQIYSMDGILILTEYFEMNENFIDVSTLNSGMYLIKIVQGDRVITNTFIKN